MITVRVKPGKVLHALMPALRSLSRSHRRPVYPHRAEERAKQRILRLLAPMPEQLRRVMPELGSRWRQRLDGPQDEEWFSDLLDDMVLGFDRASTGAEIWHGARAITHDIDADNRRTVQLAIGADPFEHEPWLGRVLEAATRENVALIKSVPRRYFGSISDLLNTSYSQGLRWEEVEEQLTASFLESGGSESELGIATRRAGLIARDQVGKIGSALTTSRFGDAGITKYIWRTAQDERVRGAPGGKYPRARPSHWAREGKVYEIDSPPEEDEYDGPPGYPFLCRCVMEPVIDEDT